MFDLMGIMNWFTTFINNNPIIIGVLTAYWLIRIGILVIKWVRLTKAGY
jgi:hypothetical protein